MYIIGSLFNLKVNKIKAPVKHGDIVGSAEVIDQDGNIIDAYSYITANDRKTLISEYKLVEVSVYVTAKIVD